VRSGFFAYSKPAPTLPNDLTNGSPAFTSHSLEELSVQEPTFREVTILRATDTAKLDQGFDEKNLPHNTMNYRIIQEY